MHLLIPVPTLILDFQLKIQDLISEIYNDGRFYKIVCSWKALEEGDLSLVEGEIVELKPLPLDVKKKGLLYGRSLGRKRRFPNFGGLIEGPIEASYSERVWQINFIIKDQYNIKNLPYFASQLFIFLF